MTKFTAAVANWSSEDWQEVEGIACDIMGSGHQTTWRRSHRIAMYLYFRRRGRR